MQHRHLNHTEFTLAAIEDILARGRMPDWVPLIAAIRADPYGESLKKRSCCANAPYTQRPCSAA